ncbi:histidine phosphatase superfamily [Pelagophyceae sp. CCMP2097]|nr:histidine phosphatase superfamily [Pelagophyceae sp. CCMP2097]
MPFCVAVLASMSCAAALSVVSPPASLRNTYFAVRHGQSTANVANIISSNPILGSNAHELTPLGKVQALEAGESLWQALEPFGFGLENVALYSSNFTRARETKELVACALERRWQACTGLFDAPPLRSGVLGALRERDFGKLDGKNTGAYDVVWPRDLQDAFDETDGVESVASVCARLSKMVEMLEKRHDGDAIALVAHADVIQIFQLWFGHADVRTFSSYRFKNGEVRLCDAKGLSLPKPAPMQSQAGVAA